MEEVKKNKKKNKVASLLLALALILTCGVAGTIAQYQKSFTGGSLATVAKFNVTDKNTVKNIQLFDTILDTKDAANETDVTQSSGKAAVIAPGTEGVVEVTLDNDSDVNVEYALKITMPKGSGVYTGGTTEQFIPLEFATVEDNKPTTANDFKNAFDKTKNTTGTIIDLGTATANSNNETVLVTPPTNNLPTMQTKDTKKIYICWRWAFESGTTEQEKQARIDLDTAIGEAIANSSSTFTAPTVNISLVCTQVD